MTSNFNKKKESILGTPHDFAFSVNDEYRFSSQRVDYKLYIYLQS